ncbi:hypothetical protein L8T67_00495 [Campylobacter lari]|nr:hypothetical protein [Campylobacter lari]
MKKYNVVLLGGSNSVMVNGLQKGLRQENVNLTNLALGTTNSIQNLYELKRERNQKAIKNADLIVSESNVNEIWQNYHEKEKLSLKIIYRNINWLYEELYFLNKKILVILLPVENIQGFNTSLINNIHLKLSKKYGFNVINMQHYNEIILKDLLHPFDFFSKQLGFNISKNINNFKNSFNNKINKKNPNFLFCLPNEMIDNKEFIKQEIKNSMYKEKVFKIQNNKILIFPKKYINYRVIAISTWLQTSERKYGKLFIENNKLNISKDCSPWYAILELHNKLSIDNKTIVSGEKQSNKKYIEEYFHHSLSWCDLYKRANNMYIISFLLASPKGNFYEKYVDFEALANEIIEIPKEYNFNHLIPPIEWYKEIIDEYCSIMDPRKLAPLQTQITNLTNEKQSLINEKTNLQNQLNQFQNTLNSLPIKKQQLEISNLEQDLINKKLQTKQLSKKLGIKMNDFMPKITMINPNSAKARIQNQLSYKLGQAMIVNSKSILGYIRMPFVLSYIKDKHKLEQKIYQEKIKKDPSLKLPPLESYPDYQEVLKEKECLTYKLGQALIQANKTWYGGGYIKLLFEIRKLKREFKKV